MQGFVEKKTDFAESRQIFPHLQRPAVSRIALKIRIRGNFRYDTIRVMGKTQIQGHQLERHGKGNNYR